MMKTKTVTQVTSIFLLGCAIIFGILFLFRTQRVWAQKYTSNDQSAANDLYGVNQAELTLTKKGHPHAYDHVGQVITYNYVVKNTGTEPISDTITVTDDKLVVSCTQPPDGVLSPNERMNCTGTYFITQADLDAGNVTNVATASGGGITSNQATETIHAVVTSSLQLTKLAVPTIYDQAGQAIDYSYVILNTGTVTLSGPFSVVDDKVSATCTQPADGTLSPGETMNCTAIYTITQADLDAGSVTNQATASGGGVTSNQATVTVTAVQTKSLTLTKLAEPLTYDHVGQIITYTYLITNTGNITLAEPFSVMDDKTTVDCTQPADGALSPGESMDCTATYTITQADMDEGSVTNHAIAVGGGVTSNEDTATVTAAQANSLLLTKRGNPQSYDQVGQMIDYSYVITNTGNVTLADEFSVEDNKAPVECTQPGDGSLSPGESMNCTSTYTITQADLDIGSVMNLAVASGGGAISNQATETVTAVQTRSLLLTKVADPMTYDHPGQMISYTYSVKNTGNVSINGPFTVFDDKVTNETCPPSPTFLPPGQSIDCTASYTILEGDMSSGSVTNMAYATGNFGGDTVTSNTDSVTIMAVQTLKYNYLPMVLTYLPPGVYILPNSSQYVSRNTMFVIGEVLNNTQDSLSLVEVPVSFYDAEGNLVGGSSAYLWPLDLPASEKGCFKIATQVPQNWSYYQLGVPKYTIDLTSLGLAINNDSVVFNPANGDYDIFGQVKNYGDQRSNSVSVSGTLYDSAGVPVGCEYGTVIGNDLDPGQTSGFEINYSGYYRNYKDVAYYKLRVAGQRP
jgi:uncharacterized repeat protein (TIGR01451 family)